MKIEFHRTGTERKALVTALAEILETRPKYKGMPSAAYEVGNFTVTKDGTLEFDDTLDDAILENLLERLANYGIAAAAPEMAQTWLDARAAELSEESGTEPQEENVGLTVEIPLDKVAVGNLTKLLDAKGNLIRKALGITDLRIEVLDDRVVFPWFSQVDADSAAAYTHFISALCEMSKNAKRVTATEKPVDNEKYAFRCFLLRLGFIGAEYKMERKILLKNLSGNSAFKTKVDVLQPEPVPSAMYVAADENPDLTEALLDEILIQQVNREMEDDRNEISE